MKGSSVAVRVVAGGRQDPHAALDQRQDAELLGDELAGKPAGVLDQNRSHAVTLNAIKEGEKAWPRLDGIGAA